MEYIKDFKAHDDLRKSFNKLACKTFGIEFEKWFQYGYWTKKYIPYSYVDRGKVAANVSVNILDLVINGEQVSAIQVGTVMTDPDYRENGYSRMLMEKVIEEYSGIDLVYLFANQSVLDFYPKFGFERIAETNFSIAHSFSETYKGRIRRLDCSNPGDLHFIYKMAANRSPLSSIFSTIGTEELLLFYAINVFPNDFYFVEELNSIVVCQNEGTVLHLFDIISEDMDQVKSDHIINKFADEKTEKVIFHFTPEFKGLTYQKEANTGSNPLFVRNQKNIGFPEFFKHPITSQA